MPPQAGTTATLAPLTTIFTYPSDCFTSLPTHWTECLPKTLDYNAPQCYWSVSASCWPSGGSARTGGLYRGLENTYAPDASSAAFIVTSFLAYSPAVAPSNFDALSSWYSGSITGAAACLSGWSDYSNLCASSVSATYSIPGSAQTTGLVSAILPALILSWAPSDLPNFTPASAPVLPTASIAAYEASVSRSKARAGPTTQTIIATGPATASASSNSAQDKGLSTGAEAGIGVGVTVGILACIILAFFILRRKRKRRVGGAEQPDSKEPYSPRGVQQLDSKKPYLDQKAELDNAEADRKAELDNSEADRRTHELEVSERKEIAADSIEPPSIPYASKPRFSPQGVSELEGGFVGHEAGTAKE